MKDRLFYFSTATIRSLLILGLAIFFISFTNVPVYAADREAISTIDTLKPDLIVAKDGSGSFKTLGEALLYVTNASNHRIIIYVKNGVYNEKVTINRSNVTIIGESRKNTRIEFSIPAGNESISRGVFNIFGNGVILENLTIANTYPHRRHTFALYGRGSFVLTKNCDFIANGNDTVALWAEGGGYYYHDNCHFEGNIDFLCPRGWCYVNNSTFYEVDTRAALWHDGGKDPGKKLVIKKSKFDGARSYPLGRYPRDSQFYLIGCQFSDSTRNIIDTNAPSSPNDDFQWGRRVYFADCSAATGKPEWLSNNLSKAAGAPAISDITAKWTFDNKWDPERTDAPEVLEVKIGKVHRTVDVVFSEPVTVRGNPIIKTKAGKILKWTASNGGTVLRFALLAKGDKPEKIDVGQGLIFASEPSVKIRAADLKLKP